MKSPRTPGNILPPDCSEETANMHETENKKEEKKNEVEKDDSLAPDRTLITYKAFYFLFFFFIRINVSIFDNLF